MKIRYLFWVVPFLILTACGGGGSERGRARNFVKNPVDILIRDMSSEKNFTIILHDMDYDEGSDKYFHQYQVLLEKANPDTLLETITDMKEVSATYFEEHQNDMGMELASKADGKLTKAVSPPGYSNYIGNEKYGHWRKDNSGNSFWEFYGKYAFMSSMFRLAFAPAYYSVYSPWYTGYRGYGRPYYGTYGGRNYYGTNSTYSSKARSNSRWQKKPQTFKDRVRSRVKQSASRQRAAKSRTSSRRSRSSSRYSRSSSRSRGGGFGK